MSGRGVRCHVQALIFISSCSTVMHFPYAASAPLMHCTGMADVLISTWAASKFEIGGVPAWMLNGCGLIVDSLFIRVFGSGGFRLLGCEGPI